MWVDYVKQKEEGKVLENFQGGHGCMKQEKQRKNQNAKSLALLINKNFTDYVEKIENHPGRIIACKIKLHGKNNYKSYKSMPLHATTTTVKLLYEELEQIYGQERLQPPHNNGRLQRQNWSEKHKRQYENAQDPLEQATEMRERKDSWILLKKTTW